MSSKPPDLRNSSGWTIGQIEEFLEQAVIPIRVGCLTEDGRPLVCSLWFLYEGGLIYCATQESARLVAMLEASPEVAFEIAGDDMPYRGVRGQGRATVSKADGAKTLRRLINRYVEDQETGFAHWLETRSANEVALVIEPDWLTSWDFSARMRDG